MTTVLNTTTVRVNEMIVSTAILSDGEILRHTSQGPMEEHQAYFDDYVSESVKSKNEFARMDAIAQEKKRNMPAGL